MCSLRMLAPALVPPTVTPCALRTRMSFATGVPPSSVVSRNWLPPVKKMPVASSMPPQAAGLLAVAARVEIHDGHLRGAQVLENAS